ncbi:MAG: hypothetical protein KGY99_04570 [Phycisphaerae bacterium]|nr:hypothetical protein [Phycisphaerae bacterium]
MLKKTVLWLLVAALPLTGGCRAVRYLAYLFAPGSRTRSVDAAFADLKGQRVAVVVFTDIHTQYEYPRARSRLAQRVTAELDDKVDDVETVDPQAVLAYQRENPYWDAEDKTALAERFDADYVLFVAVTEYAMREPGSTTLYRGRITAEASVYEGGVPERAARIWQTDRVATRYPEDAAMGNPEGSLIRIRDRTEQRFVAKLVKNFYKHREEVEP